MTLDEYLADLAAKARRHSAGPSAAAEKSRVEFDDAFSPDTCATLVAVAEAARTFNDKPSQMWAMRDLEIALNHLTALARTR